MDMCDDSTDLIVLPESCDIPCLATTLEQRMTSVDKFKEVILKKSSETAKRCNAVLFVNARFKAETKEFLDMGIDTILTNDYNIISQVVKNF